MSNEIKEEIPLLNDLVDEVFEDTNSFVQDITSSIKLMPLAVIGSLALAVAAFWFYFDILKTSLGMNVGSFAAVLAIGCFLYAAVVIIKRYYQFKEKYSRLFTLRDEWEAIKEKR